jgi:hypothetical protein
MDVLSILKSALVGVSGVIEVVENFIPAGEFKTILGTVDSVIKEALAAIPAALEAEEKSGEIKAKIAAAVKA